MRIIILPPVHSVGGVRMKPLMIVRGSDTTVMESIQFLREAGVNVVDAGKKE